MERTASVSENPKSKCFIISQRCILCILSCCAIACSYVGTLAFTNTLRYMSDRKYPIPQSNQTCPAGEQTEYDFRMGYYYTWDQTAQAILRCSRYISYILIHVPAGYLADQFGGKQVLMVALLGMSFFCFIIPTVVQISIENCVFVVVVKILSGLFEGAIYPSVNAVLAQWTPDKDRTSTACYVYTGAPIGVIMAIVLTNSVAIVTRHWPSVFYFFGSVLVILCVAWKLFAYSAPEIHPCITNKERNYLEEELEGNVIFGRKPVPWTDITRSGPLWALIVIHMGHNWGWFILMNYFPFYVIQILRFQVTNNFMWTWIPFFFMWILAIIFACLSDWLIYDNYVNVTTVRKIFTTIGVLGPALFLLLASFTTCKQIINIIWMISAVSLMGGYYTGTNVIILDLAPNFAGTVMGIVSGFGAFVAMLTPIVTTFLTPQNTLHQWQEVFWVTAIILGVTTLIFLIFGSAERQQWNDVDVDF
ncbi:hypothetical protein MTP99_017861 [Tenebrio molitor]|nr:hypothetical protein MTP99_017861 [Tenebrio molitor]